MTRRFTSTVIAAALAASPAAAQIRNAPAPRALEFAAYVFAASNVCGWRIDVVQFEALLAKQNTRAEDVSPRGPFGGRVQGMFALMSNQMMQNRERACEAIAGEYGPEGSVAKNLLLTSADQQPTPKPEPAKPETSRPEPAKPEPEAGKPAPEKPAEAPASKP